jgi:hypothetical protein
MELARRGRGVIRRGIGARTAVARLVAAVALAFSSGRALPSDFFGPSQGLQIQPELDVFQEFSRDFRLILKVLPTFIPSQSYSEMGAGLYAAWFVAPMLTGTITPDLTRRRRLDVRLGLEWYPSLEAGTAGASNILQAEAEVTPRLVITPGRLLFTCRNRVEARWQLEAPTSFAWRVRFRPQLEREFGVSDTVSLTPFANAEVIWSTSRDMWDQFRMQVGLQLGAYWFGKGQVIEVSASVFTYLQPSRSYAPVVGAVWYQFF